MSDSFPVHVAVRRADGSTEQIRVGTAYREGDGFRLELGQLSIGSTADRGAPAGRPQQRAAAPQASYGGGSYGGGGGGGDSGMRFPNYGRSKGAPIYGATEGDLEYYANGARRSLGDPSKARFHDKERQLLAAIEAEIARQRGEGGGGGGGGYGDDGVPPPSDSDAPPHGDDDAPF